MAASGKASRAILQYSLAAALPLVLVFCALVLWRAEVEVPLRLEYDATFYAYAVKSTMDNGWLFPNEHVSAPFAQDLRDFPQCDHLHLLLCKALGWVLGDFGTVMNVYYLLSFPLVAVVSLAVFRRLGLSYGPALVVSVLYAMLPIHLLRYYHIFLMAYYLVPLMVLVMLWVADDVPPFHARAPGGRLRFTFRTRRSLATIIIVALLVTSGPYYSYFGMAILLVFALLTSLRLRRKQPFVSALTIFALMALVGLVNLLPYLKFYWDHGFNLASPRWGAEVERYGLKIAGMLLPVPQHLLPPLAALRKAYAPWGNLNGAWSTPLGLAGSVGFVYLMFRLLLRALPGARRAREDDRGALLSKLSALNLAGVLLATVGGFSSLVALMGFYMIRCYDRMVIYIGFFCLAAVGVLLERLWQRAVARRKTRIAAVVLGVLLLAGAADQASPWAVPDYDRFHEEWRSDREFVGRIETKMPAGAMIFQLPVVKFPGQAEAGEMRDYDPIIAYLHSTDLRWSYGAILGRYPAAWQRWVARKPREKFLQTICRAGFTGLYLDRLGYEADEVSPEAVLQRLIGAGPLVSPNERLLFFDLREYAVRKGLSVAADEAARREIYPVLSTFAGGFVKTKDDVDETSRWGYTWCLLQMHNPDERPRTVAISMTLRTDYEEPSTIKIVGPDLSRRLEVTEAPVLLRATLTLPPGDSVIRFDTVAGEAHGDPVHRAFRVEDYRIAENAP